MKFVRNEFHQKSCFLIIIRVFAKGEYIRLDLLQILGTTIKDLIVTRSACGKTASIISTFGELGIKKEIPV